MRARIAKQNGNVAQDSGSALEAKKKFPIDHSSDGDIKKPTALPQPDKAHPLAEHQGTLIVLGKLDGISLIGRPLVSWPMGQQTSVVAVSIVPVRSDDIGRIVALSFPTGLSGQPLLLGFIWKGGETAMPFSVETDQEAVEIASQESVIIRSGKASITLMADGQILLRGTYIVSHSTGTQRIKGASVKIN